MPVRQGQLVQNRHYTNYPRELSVVAGCLCSAIIMHMNATENGGRWFALPLVVLPLLYVVVVVLTAIVSLWMPGGAFYRIIGINPVLGAFMMVNDNAAVIVGGFLVSGLPWWYLVGRIGWESRNGRISRWSSGLGALLTIYTCVLSTAVSIGVLKNDRREGAMNDAAIVQYSLVALLCFGALVCRSMH